ncbi:MAG: sigma-70 family RNA polymerase sigma factor [Ruminococcaceae bacterium]|nr:sigma-70 family RNA polymerase sigma factor [Oscillospiraceae bacterium]
MNDTEIIDLFWARSENAITELQTKYDKYARAVAMNILRDPLDTDECMNDSYLGMWNSLPPHRPQILPAFFTAVTRNTALKLYRYRSSPKRPAPTEELTDLVGSVPSPEEEIGGISESISEFLATLERDSRILFMLRYYLGESISDCAKTMGISDGSARVKLMRLRNKLKEKLEKEGFTI